MSRKIFCILYGEEAPFVVKVEGTLTVAELNQKIKDMKQNTLANLDANLLRLYKIDIVGPNPEERAKRIEQKVQTLRTRDVLDPLSTLARLYPSGPPPALIHIFVQ